MRILLLSLLVALITSACQPARVPAATSRPSPSAAEGLTPISQTASPSETAVPAPSGPDVTSAWVSCDAGIAGKGICISPELQYIPVRVCEQAAGVCHEYIPAQVPTQVAIPRALLREAHQTLVQNYVEPFDSRVVFQAALDAVSKELRDRGLQPPVVQMPTLSGDGDADWAVFARHYAALADLAPDSGVQQVQLMHAAIRGMAAGIDEGHTLFLGPRQYQDHLAWQRGDLRYAGIGVRLAGDPPMVYEVFPDTPAERAGLRYGDRIIGAAGRPTTDMQLDHVVALIRGEAGTSIRLNVRRAGGADEEVTLVRDAVLVDFIQSATLDAPLGPVGYIRLRGFPEPSVATEIGRALADFNARGVKVLVLDLRGNSGGRLDVGTDVLGMFLADKSAYTEVTRDGRRTVRTPDGDARAAGIPLAVLVDGGTASMGEIFAAAIQDNRAGTVVGTSTAGNVAAGRVFPLSDGSALQVTVFRLESSAGRKLNRVGVQPDRVVDRTPADVQNGRDPQLAAALSDLAATLDHRAAMPLAGAALFP